jgi:methenyltetrahydromethanopterin cyclohydrolase
VVADLLARIEDLRVETHAVEGGGRVIDCGIQTPGGLAAGLALARVCLAGLAQVSLVPGEVGGTACPLVQVWTDHPVAACLGSQYAGWQLAEGKFFAMGSGPMRAAYAHEPIFARIGVAENAWQVVGVLEGRKLPPPEIVDRVAQACRVDRAGVTLLIAPTASLAGGVQVVARSVETALHKLAELGFDLSRIVAGYGTAPLPPVAKGDLAAIGRTNDAVLYGARVVLDVTGDDDSLAEIGPRVPSSASRDHGEPFAAIFARYNHDFYAVDPHLFSPAEVVFRNIETGRTHAHGQCLPEVLARSFAE